MVRSFYQSQRFSVSTRKLSASSVTQTWQVGPNHNSHTQDSAEEVESTHTVLLPNARVDIYSSAESKAREIDLVPGANSFKIGKTHLFEHGQGSLPDALFEISVQKSGAFFSNVSKNTNIFLNAKIESSSRLRVGDEIRLGSNRLVYSGEGCSGPENTFVFGVVSSNHAPELKNENSTQKVLFWPFGRSLLLISGCLAVSLLVIVIGFDFSKEDEPGEKITAKVETISQGLLDSTDIAARGFIINTLPLAGPVEAVKSREFGKVEFENIIQNYRQGKKESACLEMSKGIEDAPLNNIWTHKAELFIQRRCL